MEALQLKEEVQVGSAYLYLPGEGKNVSARGASVTFKATSADTNGAWGLTEYVAPPHFAGPPPHWHKETSEGFYILSGTMTFKLEDQTLKAPAGSFVLVPPGTVHTFSNEEPVPATFLTFLSPAGFERYFEELADLLQQTPPPNPEQFAALSSRYDLYPPSAR